MTRNLRGERALADHYSLCTTDKEKNGKEGRLVEADHAQPSVDRLMVGDGSLLGLGVRLLGNTTAFPILRRGLAQFIKREGYRDHPLVDGRKF